MGNFTVDLIPSSVYMWMLYANLMSIVWIEVVGECEEERRERGVGRQREHDSSHLGLTSSSFFRLQP